MAEFGLKTLSIGGVSMIAMRASDIILGRIAGIPALGYYSRASAISNAIFQNVYGSISRVLFAKLAEDDRRGAGVAAAYLRSLDIILAILWPMLAGLAILSRPVVAQLFGQRWSLAADPLFVLMIVQMAGLSFAMHTELFILRDRIGEQSKLEVWRTAIGLAAFSYGCTVGLVGAATALLVNPLVGMILYLPRLPGLSGAAGRSIATLLLRNFCISLFTVAPALALMVIRGWPYHVSAPAGAGVVLAGGLAWIAALGLSGHPLYQEIRRILVAATPTRRPVRGN